MRTGYDYSWFVLTQKVIEKEFALSGSEQNPDLTGKDIKLLLSRVKKGAPGPVEAFKQHGEDFVVADNLTDLVAGMNRVAGSSLITEESLRRTITERDRQLDNPYSKDTQVTFIRGHRNYRGDKLIRVASPHKFLDPANGPLIAVRLNILSRKTLGGLHTDLDARVLQPDGRAVAGRLRSRRGRRLRRWWRARLQRARGHLPRWLHLLRPYGGPGRRRCPRLTQKPDSPMRTDPVQPQSRVRMHRTIPSLVGRPMPV